MLPTLEIDFTKVCHMEPDVFGDGQYKVAAYTHIYNAEALRGVAVAVGENLDGFLSKTILRSMMSNQVKTKLIFFYVVYQDFIEVSVSNVNLRARCDWLCNIEGHYESGRAFLQENAKPFMFWDGSNLYRLKVTVIIMVFKSE